jgi:zinc transport system permease protein
MAFIGHGISHAAFGGVALALLLGFDPFLGAISFCLGVGLLISWLSQHKRVSEDSAIGLTLTMTMALGSILLALRKGYTPDIFGYLFGDILLILPQDLPWILGSCTLVLAVVLCLFRPLYNFSFHEELAWVEGLPVHLLHFLLVSLLSLVIVVSVKLVGVILISAFLLIPGLSAFQLSSHISRIFWLSFLFSVVSIVAGLFVSYFLDIPSGATIVNLQFLLFMLTMALQKFLMKKSSLTRKHP